QPSVHSREGRNPSLVLGPRFRGDERLTSHQLEQTSGRLTYARRCRRFGMSLEPVSRSALRAADLGIAHLLGNLAAQLGCLLVTAHRSDVEPLVRLHEVNRDPCSPPCPCSSSQPPFSPAGAPKRRQVASFAQTKSFERCDLRGKI